MVWVLQYTLHIVNILLFIRYVRCVDENESGDYIQRKSVEEFKRLCPFTDLCYSKARRNSTEVHYPEYPCCRQCDCDVNFDTGSCPDRPERFLNDAEVLQVKQATEQCVRAQFRRYSLMKLNGKSYTMIGHCPLNYKDADVIFKCSREYHDFNFENDDVTTLMPVSSETLNVTFRNYYCAVCHGLAQAKLHYWETKIKCQNRRKLLVSTIYEIPSRLSEEPLCQVVFEPSYTTSVNTCSARVDKCNVTGTWKTYDKTLESACLSYTSEYKSFRNIHCFLCNGHTFTDIADLCVHEELSSGYESFVALLDFNDLEGPTNEYDTVGNTCARSSKYDPYKKKCRSLSCPYGMLLSKGRCVPLYTSVTDFYSNNIAFGLRFNLMSDTTNNLGWRHLDILASAVWNDMLSKLRLIYTTYHVSVCTFNPYIKLKHSLEDTVFYMGLDNHTDFMPFFSHIAVAVEFNIGATRNISETLAEMAVMFTLNDIYAHYSIQYPSDDHFISLEDNHHIVSDDFIEDLNALLLEHHEYSMFMNGFNDPDDGLGILWFLDGDLLPLLPPHVCDVAISIQPLPFCPRVELDRKEFNIDIDSRRVTTLESDASALNLTFSKILSSKHTNSVLVCIDEYFSQLPSENHTKVDNTLVILTLICLVPSIASLLLSFLVYCVLPSLRTLPGLNNMALVFHLLLAQIFAIVNTFADIDISWLCSAVGIVLHYTLVSSFLWMFICTLHMMIVFVKIKERSFSVHTIRKFVHYLLFVEVMSALLVVSNVVVSVFTAGRQAGFGYGGSSCYIRDSRMILYFVAVPLGVILVANLVMFVFVVWHVARLPDMAESSNHERKNILIFAKLSTLTGITWTFGFLYQFFDVILFAYAYIVFNAGQGVFIMLSFIINKRVFGMLRTRWHKKTHDKAEGITHRTTASAITENVETVNSISCNTKF